MTLREVTTPNKKNAMLDVWARLNDSVSNNTSWLHQIKKSTNLPPPRNLPQRRILELFRMPLRIAQLTVLINPSGEQVVEQPLLHLLELGDHLLGLADGLVESVEDLSDAALSGRGTRGISKCATSDSLTAG
jgi:hypothetical protein